MDRDGRFRSWFQRAMQMSPQLGQLEQEGKDETAEGEMEEVKQDHFSNVDEGARPKTRASRGMSPMDINYWSLLLKDNVRFWDCLAMLRSDPGLSCHSSIYLVTQSPDSEYFSDDLRSCYSNYLKNEDDLQIEVLRLRVENRKLHAVLWVLSDNPQFRVDSVVAAIFRLSETQFGEKFLFVYQPGCFSGKSPVLGPAPKGTDPGRSSFASRTKRCRSSTPVRTCRPLRHVSERLCHSVNRGNAFRAGKNISSNKCKYEPPRKRRSNWMKSALLTGLENKSTNNILPGYDEIDDDHRTDYDNDGDDDDDDDDDDDNENEGDFEEKQDLHSQFDDIQLVGGDAAKSSGNDYDGYYKMAALSSKIMTSGRRKVAKSRKQSRSSKPFNDNTAWGPGSYYPNNNNNSLYNYIDMFFEEGAQLPIPRKQSLRSYARKAPSTNEFPAMSLGESQSFLPGSTKSPFRIVTINSLIFQELQTNAHHKNDKRPSNRKFSSVQFQICPPRVSRETPTITYSNAPRQVVNRSEPYAFSINDNPADFILQQKQHMQAMTKTQTKHDISFCLKRQRKNNRWQKVTPNANLPQIGNDSSKPSQRNKDGCKKINKMHYKRAAAPLVPLSADRPSSHKKTPSENTKEKQTTPKSSKTDNKEAEGSESENDETDLKEKGLIPPSAPEVTEPGAVRRQERLLNWNTRPDRYECMKNSLLKMGRRPYTKPLLTYINRVSAGKAHTPW